ncbi:MAG: hypothetical protein D6691_01470 [Candidatus Hydrogenedentota bacterium]|nr:MAG: hypothetical protein D6691_01470 [Candidatus Hydrogenedentota bacterium]GIX45204.1 MAG: hypothetical protein KatS3mg130_1612 [Candidatus Sumerlaea sp.]
MKCYQKYAIIVFALFATWSFGAENKIRSDAPSTAPRIHILLTASVSADEAPYPDFPSLPPAPAPPVDPKVDRVLRNEKFECKQLIGSACDMVFIAYGRKAQNIPFLTHQNVVTELLVLGIPKSGGPAKQIARGHVMGGNPVKIQYECTCEPIGVNKLSQFPVKMQVAVGGTTPKGELFIQRSLMVPTQLSGKVEQGNLVFSASMSGMEGRKVPPDLKVNLSITFANRPDIPALSASGPFNGLLRIRDFVFVVESLAEDLSEITFAQIDGPPLNTLTPELVEPKPITELPAFYATDIVARKLWNRDTLLSATEGQKPLILVFGDLSGVTSYESYPRPLMTLPMDEANLVETIRARCESQPVIAIVTRSIPIKLLVEQYLTKPAPCIILSDYQDPKFLNVRSYSPPAYYPNQPDTPTLRGALRLPDQALAVVACDPTGKILFSKTCKSEQFVATLNELALKVCKE